jgi:hypothetical protein
MKAAAAAVKSTFPDTSLITSYVIIGCSVRQKLFFAMITASSMMSSRSRDQSIDTGHRA